MSEAYIPGVCNINRAEVARRRKWGIVGIVLFLLLPAIMISLSLNRWLRLVAFVPGFIGVLGFLQAKNKFCVSYAASGFQNASENSKKAQRIADETARAKDKSRARIMNLQAAAVAVVLTLLAVAT